MIRPFLFAPLALAAFTSTALAHFILVEPKPTMTPTADKGDPQTDGPCGGGTPTTDITNLTPGQTLNVKLNVAVVHTGFIRVTLAKEGDLFSVPQGAACNTYQLNQNPKAPILLEKVVATSGENTLTVKVPDGANCPDCRLQVIQFSNSGGAPCAYYHCAKVTVGAATSAPDAGPTGTDAGNGTDGGAGNNNSGGGSSGGCSTSGGQAGWALIALGVLLQFTRRRSGK